MNQKILIDGESYDIKNSTTQLKFNVMLQLEAIGAEEMKRKTKIGANEYLRSLNLGTIADFEYTNDYINPVEADMYQQTLIKKKGYIIIPVEIPIDFQQKK